ncbi:MAG: ester cyclase [Solirubrobacteraceae bacterium MAG38_C4-C5]|nr:ester cyclase [Candidatus Siliceabacter maunaloa]
MTADELMDGWQAAWSGRDPDAFGPLCAPGVHYEDPLTAEPLEGPGAIGAHAQKLWTAFPDVRMEKTGPRLRDGAGYLAAPVKVLGTHRGEVDDLAPTRKFVVVQAVWFCQVDERGSHLWRVRAFFDLYDAAVQASVLPVHGSLGERALFMMRGFGLRR